MAFGIRLFIAFLTLIAFWSLAYWRANEKIRRELFDPRENWLMLPGIVILLAFGYRLTFVLEALLKVRRR